MDIPDTWAVFFSISDRVRTKSIILNLGTVIILPDLVCVERRRFCVLIPTLQPPFLASKLSCKWNPLSVCTQKSLKHRRFV